MGFRVASCCCSLSKGDGSTSDGTIVKKSDLPYIQKDLGDLEWYKEFLPKSEKQLDILHFNDVYDIEERPSKDQNESAIAAGASRFTRALQLYGSEKKLVIFSGDFLFPSMLSTRFRGKQMIYPFEQFNVNISCLGNHELDRGIEHAESMLAETSCPWILSNLFQKDRDMRPIAGVEKWKVLEHSGFRIGFMGFAEEQWLDQLCPDIDCSKLEYQDYNQTLQELSKTLKEQENCDLLIAINHMRLPEDEDMAAKNKAPDVVDMIFGGHDHCYARKLNQETGVFIQKSGTDFECFTNLTVLFGVDQSDHESYMTQLKDKMPTNVGKGMIEVFYNPELKRMFISERVNVTRKFAPVKEVSLHVESYVNQLREMQDRTALISEVQFEGRFSRVRTQETNLGDFVADLIRTEFQADFGLYNGGGLRANCVFDTGVLPFRFISQVLPNEDKIVKLSLQGRLFKQVLENGVSLYPKYDGRWPVISGIHFSFDPAQDAGSRIIEDTMKDDEGQQIDMDKTYTVALMQFFTAGKDGNEALLDPSIVNHCPDMEDAPTIQSIILQFLEKLSLPNEQIEQFDEQRKSKFMDRLQRFNTSIDNRCGDTGLIKLAPRTSGRVTCLGPELEHQD